MNYDLILNKLKLWACSLIILQYRQAPKNRKTIEMLVDLIFANNIFIKIKNECLNVEKSIGAQLDVIGKWVGVDRWFYGDLWEGDFFSLPGYHMIEANVYPTNTGGFSDYTNFEDLAGGFVDYNTIIETQTKVNALGDSFYRDLIKLKIIKNSINHTCYNIDKAIYEWSNGEVYTTWGDMVLNYHYSDDYSVIMDLAQQKECLPAPTGVKVNLIQY